MPDVDNDYVIDVCKHGNIVASLEKNVTRHGFCFKNVSSVTSVLKNVLMAQDIQGE